MKKYSPAAIYLVVGIAILLFWAIPYRGALNFHEQFQLFLCDKEYFRQHLTTKGGLAVYVSEFLVQFYNNWWIGAGIITAEMLLIHFLVWRILRRIFPQKYDTWLFLAAFLPMFLVWLEIGNINTMHSLFIAVIEELAFAYILTNILTSERLKGRAVLKTAIFVPLLVLFVGIYLWTAGPNHHRSETTKFSFSDIFDQSTYELIDYDFLVRANDWKGIIKKAEEKKPEAEMSVAATNLALGMTQQLGRRAEQFPQPGTAGLVPPFTRESFSLLTTAEIYYQLGLVNTAQRYYFESMEGLPNGKKSCRCIRRLVQTNLINGQYDVAKKYLRLLQKTVFYKLWATNTLELIERGEDAINAHPHYGRMRRLRLTDDFLFFEKEIDMVCGRLFLQNRNNTLAMQYMLMHPLLDNNLEKFLKYMQVVDECLPNTPEAESFRRFATNAKR